MEVIYLKELERNLNYLKGIIHPSTEVQVNDLELTIKKKLPKALREFFIMSGNDYDMFLRGGGGGPQSIHSLDEIKKVSEKLLLECNVKLKDDYFSFLEYGDQFLFFYFKDGDNPPVYRFELELFHCGEEYMPGSDQWGYPKGVSKVANRFSEMIDGIVEAEVKQTKQ